MILYYERVDITRNVEIRKAEIIDSSGGKPDGVDLILADTESLWSKWKPRKGDTVKLSDEGFSSGIMYVDHLQQNRGSITLKALSIPLNARTSVTKAWEKIRLYDLAADIAKKHGFTVETYGTTNWLYERADQLDQADFEFLAYRCMLEGYCLKITDKKVVIYSESAYEQNTSVKTIYAEQMDGGYEFKTISTGLYNSCFLSCNNLNGIIKTNFAPSSAPAGAILKPKVYVNNQAESDRFATALLRCANKYETTGAICIELDNTLAAACNINISGTGMSDGKYFIDQVTHKLVEKKTVLKLRKLLEGY